MFDSNDFVAAFIDGWYEQGPYPGNGGVASVPEPGSLVLLILGAVGMVGRRVRNKR